MERCSKLAWMLFMLAASPSASTAQTKIALGSDVVLFGLSTSASAGDWGPFTLPTVESKQPAPTVEYVPAEKSTVNDPNAANGVLKITFRGGNWPAVATSRIPVAGNWKEFQAIHAELTVDRPSVAYFGVCQSKSEKPTQPAWETTMLLVPGRNRVTRTIRHGLSRTVIDPNKGDVTTFVIGMFQPEQGQSLFVSNVRLSPDRPLPHVSGWYSPHNHDGYSAAVAREYERTGVLTKFRVLGTDLEVADLNELAHRWKDRWTPPEPNTVEQIEADFRAELSRLRQVHPRAVLAILRQGEAGSDAAQPEQVYSGWKMVYLNCHGPDGPNRGREVTPQLGETVEVFMRHRSVLMRADLSCIPDGATVLAARLLVTRVEANDLKPADKPNMWVVEPCNREWDSASANCYFYAPRKHWKGVSGLYYGDDPDFWPTFAAHGPSGGGAVSAWDFTEAMKFWLRDGHANRGFFLHGLNDYMRMHTPLAKDIKQRPAILAIYAPK